MPGLRAAIASPCAILPLAAGIRGSQEEQRETEAEHSVHAEQSGMAMDRSEVSRAE